MATNRIGPLWLAKAAAPDAPKGTCCWCGAKLTGRNGERRRYCYPDREGRPCQREAKRAMVWDTRVALRIIADREGLAEMRCVDCSKVCEQRSPAPERCKTLVPIGESGLRLHELWRREGHDVDTIKLWGGWKHVARWDADHDVPLWADGPHAIENLRVRCVDCHREKTAREATERARRVAA